VAPIAPRVRVRHVCQCSAMHPDGYESAVASRVGRINSGILVRRTAAAIAIGTFACGYFIARSLDDPWWLPAVGLWMIWVVLWSVRLRRLV
jgi:hypothetical protein